MGQMLQTLCQLVMLITAGRPTLLANLFHCLTTLTIRTFFWIPSLTLHAAPLGHLTVFQNAICPLTAKGHWASCHQHTQLPSWRDSSPAARLPGCPSAQQYSDPDTELSIYLWWTLWCWGSANTPNTSWFRIIIQLDRDAFNPPRWW